MADKNESASVNEMEKELNGPKMDKDNPSTSQASGKSDNLEDLFSTLKQQISNSDWLEKNTADKWLKDNPELAKEYMEAAKKS